MMRTNLYNTKCDRCRTILPPGLAVISEDERRPEATIVLCADQAACIRRTAGTAEVCRIPEENRPAVALMELQTFSVYFLAFLGVYRTSASRDEMPDEQRQAVGLLLRKHYFGALPFYGATAPPRESTSC